MPAKNLAWGARSPPWKHRTEPCAIGPKTPGTTERAPTRGVRDTDGSHSPTGGWRVGVPEGGERGAGKALHPGCPLPGGPAAPAPIRASAISCGEGPGGGRQLRGDRGCPRGHAAQTHQPFTPRNRKFTLKKAPFPCGEAEREAEVVSGCRRTSTQHTSHVAQGAPHSLGSCPTALLTQSGAREV